MATKARPAWELTREDFRTRVVAPFEETDLYRRWDQRVNGDPANDFLIVVTPSSKTSGSGSGKTTVGTSLAKAFDQSDGGFDAEDKGTCDAGDLAYNILPEVESGSAVLFDESQGAPGTTSVNARRGMTAEALDAINAILGNRNKQLTTIVIAQQLGMLDKLLYHMVDAWIHIVRDPGQPGGPTAVHHTLTINDYDLGNPQIRTPAHEDLSWDRLPADDPDYLVMETKKARASRRSDGDEGTPVAEIPKALRDEKINELEELTDLSHGDLADLFDLTQQSVSRIVAGEQ